MFASILAITLAAAPLTGERLTNQTVVALHTAGIGDAAIIAKIKASEAGYDTSTDQILALKAQGVSGAVIAAMIEASAPRPAGPAPLSIDSPDPMVSHAPGVYVMQSQSGAPRMQRMDATVSNQAKTGGILGYALTGGIASMSIKAAIQNETARTKTGATPEFFFFFDESNPETARAASSWLAGSAVNVSSPAEFTLVELTKKQGRREARVGSANIGGVKTGVMDKDRLAFDYTLVRPGVYRVVPIKPLKAGEYGFIYSVTGGGSGTGAATARVYDFSVS